MADGFGLYVHVPYCRTKCPYCDFNVEAGARWPEQRYVAALVAELAHWAARPPFAGRAIETIFLGGGTPSLFEPASIAEILRVAGERFAISPAAEISLEANPENAAVERLRGYRGSGVNRLSFGVQSFDPKLLKTLGRASTVGETRTCVAAARDAGFANVSVDLIFAVPGQTLAGWREDLESAIALRPDHVSAYNLTYEDGTPLTALRDAGRIEALPDETEAAMFEAARQLLPGAGYLPYEISNFARPGFESRHNVNYWRTGAYLGIGAGSHSHEPRGDRARRWWNERDSDRYARRVAATGEAIAGEELLEPRAVATEFTFLRLRTAAGLDPADFERRFGAPLAATFPGLEGVVEEGWLERGPAGVLRLSRTGLPVADGVLARFL